MQSLVFALFAIFGHDLSYISTDLDPNTKPKNPDHCKEPLLENRTIEKRLDRIVGFATNEHVMLPRIIPQNFLRLHTRRNKKETANNGARHSGTICVGAKCSFTLTRGFLRRIAQIFVYRSIGLDFTGSEPGLISREKNGTIKCLHDHFDGADGRVWCLGDCRSAEVPEATMTTATTGDGWVDGWPRVYGLCACGSSSGTRIFQ
ncbi:hypothetical protein ALC53_13398 [Atta colombica]|uniref:Uncharacterized protein n=1 Tax=Atta colombica TaxID=520822 RepID=A0A195AW15_9HYME|nr:hypothetical protein ALC53_13398 [Atta colombica]